MADTGKPTLFLNDSAILDQLAVDYRNDTNIRLNNIANNVKVPEINLPSKFYKMNLEDYSPNVDYFSPQKEEKKESKESRLDDYSNYFKSYEQRYSKEIDRLTPEVYTYSNIRSKGEILGIPYDFDLSPEEKYTEGELGWNPQLTTAENEQIYYDKLYKDENFLKKAGYLIRGIQSNIIAKTPLKFFEGLGYVGSALNPFKMGEGYFLAVADNGFSKLMKSAQDNLKTGSWTSTYKSIDYDEKGFFSKMGTSEFWVNDFADGAAFMFSAFVPVGGIASKVIKAGISGSKLAQTGAAAIRVGSGLAEGATVSSRALGSLKFTGRLGKVTDFIYGSSEISAPIQHAYSIASEAFFETKGVIDNLKRNRELARSGELDDSELANMSDDEFNKLLGEKGANTFKANVALLAFTNAFQTRIMYKALGKTAPGSPNFIADLNGRLTNRAISEKFSKLYSNNFVNKFLKSSNKLSYGSKYLLNAGTKFGTGLGIEGYIEENSQLAIERLNSLDNEHMYYLPEDNFMVSFLKQASGQIDKATKGEDTEAATSIGLGGILGGGTSVISSMIQRKKYNINTNSNSKIEYAGLFDSKKEKANKEKWYKGFFYGEVKNKRDQKTLDNIALMNVQNIYNDYLNIHNIVNSESEEEFNAKKYNYQNNLKKTVELLNLSEDSNFTYLNPIATKAIRNLAFSKYLIAADKIGFGKDVLNAFTEIKTIDQNKLKDSLLEFGLDPDTFKESDVESYKKIGEILLKNKQKLNESGFKAGPFTFEVLDILSEHRKNQISNNMLSSYIFKNAVEEYGDPIDSKFEEINNFFSDDIRLGMLPYYKDLKTLSNLIANHELIFQNLKEDRDVISKEEIDLLEKEFEENKKAIKDLLKDIEVNTDNKDSLKDFTDTHLSILNRLYNIYESELNDPLIDKDWLAPFYTLSSSKEERVKAPLIKSYPFDTKDTLVESVKLSNKEVYISNSKKSKKLEDFLLEFHYTIKSRNGFNRLSAKQDLLTKELSSYNADQYIEWFNNKNLENRRRNEKLEKQAEDEEELRNASLTPDDKINLEEEEENEVSEGVATFSSINDILSSNLQTEDEGEEIESLGDNKDFNFLLEEFKEELEGGAIDYDTLNKAINLFKIKYPSIYHKLIGTEPYSSLEELNNVMSFLQPFIDLFYKEEGTSLDEINSLLLPDYVEHQSDLDLTETNYIIYSDVISSIVQKVFDTASPFYEAFEAASTETATEVEEVVEEVIPEEVIPEVIIETTPETEPEIEREPSPEEHEMANKILDLINLAVSNNNDLFTQEHIEDPSVVNNTLDEHINQKNKNDNIPFITKGMEEVKIVSEGEFIISSQNESFQNKYPNTIIASRAFLNKSKFRNYKLKLYIEKSPLGKPLIKGTVVNNNGETVYFDNLGTQVSSGGSIVSFILDDLYFTPSNIFKPRQEAFDLKAPVSINLIGDDLKLFSKEVEKNYNESFLEDIIKEIETNSKFPLITIENVTNGVLFRDGYQNNQTVLTGFDTINYTSIEDFLKRDRDKVKINAEEYKISSAGRLVLELLFDNKTIEFQPKPKKVRNFSTNNTKDGIILYNNSTKEKEILKIEDLIEQAIKGTLNYKYFNLLELIIDKEKFLILNTSTSGVTQIGLLSKDLLSRKIKNLDVSESLKLLTSYKEGTLLTEKELKEEVNKVLDYPIVFDKSVILSSLNNSSFNNIGFIEDSSNGQALLLKEVINKNVETSLLPIKEGNSYTYTRVNKRLVLSLPIKPKEFKERNCK